MKQHLFSYPAHSKQRGMVLPIGLMLLLMLTLVAIVAMSGTVLQERMAGALRNESIAAAGADSALRDAERWLWDWTVSTNGRELQPGDTGFAYAPLSRLGVPADGTFGGVDLALNNFRNAYDWSDTGAQSYAGNGTALDDTDSGHFSMAGNPAFVIEPLGTPSNNGERESPETSFGNSESTTGGGQQGVLVYYRITARSPGGTAGVVRVAESTFTVTR